MGDSRAGGSPGMLKREMATMGRAWVVTVPPRAAPR